MRAGSSSCAKEPQSTHERLDETLIFRLRLSCARRISSAHFDPAAGCVRYWRQCGCLLFCTRMRAIFSRDVDMTRAIHHRNDRKLLYILLTDVKIGRGSPEQPGASARRVMTSRSCDIATSSVFLFYNRLLQHVKRSTRHTRHRPLTKVHALGLTTSPQTPTRWRATAHPSASHPLYAAGPS